MMWNADSPWVYQEALEESADHLLTGSAPCSYQFLTFIARKQPDANEELQIKHSTLVLICQRFEITWFLSQSCQLVPCSFLFWVDSKGDMCSGRESLERQASQNKIIGMGFDLDFFPFSFLLLTGWMKRMSSRNYDDGFGLSCIFFSVCLNRERKLIWKQNKFWNEKQKWVTAIKVRKRKEFQSEKKLAERIFILICDF